jgi:hypothetical protein
VLAACQSSHAQAIPVPDVLVSRQLAAAEGLAEGQVVHLAPGAAGESARPFRIAGIYEPTPDPARLGAVPREVRLHLPDLLDLTRGPDTPAGTEYVDSINVALRDPARRRRSRATSTPACRASRAPDGGAHRRAATFVVLERFHYAIAPSPSSRRRCSCWR